MNKICVHGQQMYVDAKDSLNLATGLPFEPDEVALVKHYVQPGDVVIDVGANIGYYTLLFAQLVGIEGWVFAFEPEPDNFTILQQNIQLNQYHNISLVQKALSAENKTTKLFLCNENKGMHRLYPSVCCAENINVNSVRLDDELPSWVQHVNFIKMDIEGAEYLALLGMQDLIRHYKPYLLTEFSPAALFEAGVDATQYIKLLLDLGFVLYDVKLQPIDLRQLYADLRIVELVMRDLLPQLSNKSMPEVVQQVVQELTLHAYPRPLVENLFCIIS
jgi:FkbM family methyltransferase